MKTRDKLQIGMQILQAKATGVPRPFFVQYSLLNGCNARCTYCNSPHRADPQLDTATHLRLLAEFAALGTVRIKFLGGEPLLRPDLGELVAETKRLGMRAAMVTNGLLIPQSFELVKQLDELIISLDGSEAAHDGQRGRGSWRRVMAAIELCAAEGLEFFLSAVVTRDSLGEVDWMLELADSLGVMVNFQLPQFNSEMYGPQAKPQFPDEEDARAVLRKIIAAKECGAPVLFSAQSYGKTLAWPNFELERVVEEGTVSRCTAGKYFVQMEPNGDIYPCVLHVGTFAPKNAVRDGVRAAWENCHQHSCTACFNTWLNENRAIFDLSPSTLMNFWQNYLRPRRKAA
ncbi:MAG TPA: radical SAM protein [Planctomycetaceae bacterium]|nr:radical SAM protein [Planctomycetaceae bacterium]